MASIADVCSALADTISTYLAPYQPNTADVPNTDPRAGTIVATYIADGHPMQFQGTLALENGKAMIGVYDAKPEKVHSFTTKELIKGQDNVFRLEVGRTVKEFIVEIWAYKYQTRAQLVDMVRQVFGDAYSLLMTDNTYTKICYEQTFNEDTMQLDSVWISQVRLRGDFSTTQPVGDGTGYQVTETTLGYQVQDQQGNVIATYTENYP